MPHLFDKRALSEAPGEVFSHPLTVRFQDVDAAGIVFFARITAWFHDAYFSFLASRGLDLPAAIASGPYLAPMKHVEADFFRPVRFGDTLVAQVVRQHAEGSELTVGFRLLLGDEVVAVGQQVHAFVDRSFEKIDVPDEWHAVLAAIG